MPKNTTHSIVALRPPQRLLEAVDEAAFDRRESRSSVIREALSKFQPSPRIPGSPCPVRSLYVRLNSRLSLTPIGFCARPRDVRAYKRAARQAGVPSINGLVSLALAQHLSV